MGVSDARNRGEVRVAHMRHATPIGLGAAAIVAASFSAQAEPSVALPQQFYGYYVYASEINDGSRCKKDEQTPIRDLERNPENQNDHVGFQMTIRSSEIHYDGIGTHVLCKIQRVYRPEDKPSYGPKFVGPWLRPDDPVYMLDLTCFDEGTTSRGREMFRLIRLGSSIVLLETQKSLVTDAWAKCQGR